MLFHSARRPFLMVRRFIVAPVLRVTSALQPKPEGAHVCPLASPTGTTPPLYRSGVPDASGWRGLAHGQVREAQYTRADRLSNVVRRGTTAGMRTKNERPRLRLVSFRLTEEMVALLDSKARRMGAGWNRSDALREILRQERRGREEARRAGRP